MPALLFEKRHQIGYITFNRPQVHNAFSPELLVSLADAWGEVAADDQVRAAIITGSGEDAFSAGADLGRLIPLFTRARAAEDEWDRRLLENRKLGDIALLRNFSIPKPIIAAVNGFCIAGGFELLLGTDLRVAVPGATFGLQEVKWGLIPAGGSLARLQRQIGYAKTMEILLTGDRIDAIEAHRIGLINHVVPPGQLMAKAEQMARTIANNGPLAVAKIKEAVERCSGTTLQEAFDIENDVARVVFNSADAKEGPRAFMEKRQPRWTGK